MNFYDLGSRFANATTTFVVSPHFWTNWVKPQAGDHLIAIISSTRQWECPSGWTRNDGVAWRVLDGHEGTFTFALVERGAIAIRFLLGRPLTDAPATNTEEREEPNADLA